MNEALKPGEGKMPRRHFFNYLKRTAIKGVAAATVGEVAIERESRQLLEGIKTDSGTFIPLFEDHRQIIAPESIPDDTDYYFREVTGDIVPILPARYVVTASSVYEHPIIEPSILSKLSKSGSKILLLDVNVPKIDIKVFPMIKDVEYSTGMILLSSGVLMQSLETANKLVDEEGIDRRDFLGMGVSLLKKGLLTAGVWGILPGALDDFMLNNVGPSYDNKRNVVHRIVTPIRSLENSVHPEYNLNFFRNLIWAEKLLCVSEEHKKATNTNPKIVFQVGAGHAGIMDLLLVGRSSCRYLIKNIYSPEWVDEMMRVNFGAENTAMIRTVFLPPKLDPATLQKQEVLDSITERIRVDEELLKVLNSFPKPQAPEKPGQ